MTKLDQYPEIDYAATTARPAVAGESVIRSPWWLEDALAWEATVGGSVETPPLDGSLTVDVAVVGGGYTGLDRKSVV